jgi:hypothetical protein
MWPVDGAVVAAYGARYTSARGEACTHGGVDLGAAEGATVRACAPGDVVFSGQVPAGEGESAWAVTVLTADGLRVTYLPLRRVVVTKGAEVGEGDAIGELAGAGDASSPAPHLHLGVRRGDTRLDPLSLLGDRAAAPVAAPAPSAPAAPTVAPPVSSHPVASAAHDAPVPLHAPAPAHAVGPVRTSAGAPAGAAIAAPQAPALLRHVSPVEFPVLRQVSPVADAPRVRTAAVAADVGSARDFLAALLARLGLVGLAGACAWPVLRGVLEAHAERTPATVGVRRDGA